MNLLRKLAFANSITESLPIDNQSTVCYTHVCEYALTYVIVVARHPGDEMRDAGTVDGRNHLLSGWLFVRT